MLPPELSAPQLIPPEQKSSSGLFYALTSSGAAVTGAGRLPYKACIHVAGISHCWRSSEASIRKSVRSAISKAEEHGFESLGFPLIGAGTGGGSPDQVEGMIREEIEQTGYTGLAVIVRYTKKR